MLNFMKHGIYNRHIPRMHNCYMIQGWSLTLQFTPKQD